MFSSSQDWFSAKRLPAFNFDWGSDIGISERRKRQLNIRYLVWVMRAYFLDESFDTSQLRVYRKK